MTQSYDVFTGKWKMWISSVVIDEHLASLTSERCCFYGWRIEMSLLTFDIEWFHEICFYSQFTQHSTWGFTVISCKEFFYFMALYSCLQSSPPQEQSQIHTTPIIPALFVFLFIEAHVPLRKKRWGCLMECDPQYPYGEKGSVHVRLFFFFLMHSEQHRNQHRGWAFKMSLVPGKVSKVFSCEIRA